jgi:hypothetical protein
MLIGAAVMEILDLKFAGIPVSTWLILLWGLWLCKVTHKEYLDWKERRAWKKEYAAKKNVWDQQHRWEPRIVNGVDYGEWVRKDGQPIDDDDWNPAKELLGRLAEKGPR